MGGSGVRGIILILHVNWEKGEGGLLKAGWQVALC